MEEEIKEANVTKTPKTKKSKSKARKIIEWILFGVFGVIFAVVAAAQIDGMVHQKEYYGQNIRFGLGSFIVLTNSMEPVYNKGVALITYRENVETMMKTFNEYQIKNQKLVDQGKKPQYFIDITFMNINTGYSIDDADFEHEEYRSDRGGVCVYSNNVMTHRIMEIHVREGVKLGSGKYLFVTHGTNDQGSYSKQGQYQISTEKQYLGTVKVSSPALGSFFNFISSIWGLFILLLIPAAYLIVTSAIDIFRALKETEQHDEQKIIDIKPTDDENVLGSLSDEDKERLKRELLDEMMENRGGNKDD